MRLPMGFSHAVHIIMSINVSFVGRALMESLALKDADTEINDVVQLALTDPGTIQVLDHIGSPFF